MRTWYNLAGGPEYAVLRLLPAREQRRIWAATYSRESQRPWAVVSLFGLMGLAFTTTLAVDFLLGALLGGGGVLVRLASDVLTFHVLLHPFFRMWQRHLIETARPLIQDELDALLGTDRAEFLRLAALVGQLPEIAPAHSEPSH